MNFQAPSQFHEEPPDLGYESVPVRVGDSFDPLHDLLIAQMSRPAQLEHVNLRALTPFQRALLVIDGTVTKFIEGYTMEPVRVHRLAQEVHHLTCDHPWLQAPCNTKVIARQVTLNGSYSGTLYAYAGSLLVFDRLPKGVKEDLELNPGGLGRVLIDHALETRREVLWYGREYIPDLPYPVPHLADGNFISRTYRILSQGMPLMLINEKFPCTLSPGLSHD